MLYIVLGVIISILFVIIIVQSSKTKERPTHLINVQVPQSKLRFSLSDEIVKDKRDLANDIVYHLTQNTIDLNQKQLLENFVTSWIQPYHYWTKIPLTCFNHTVISPNNFFLKYFEEAVTQFTSIFNGSYSSTGVQTVIKYTEELDGDGGEPYDEKEITLSFYKLDTEVWVSRIHEINTKITLNE